MPLEALPAFFLAWLWFSTGAGGAAALGASLAFYQISVAGKIESPLAPAFGAFLGAMTLGISGLQAWTIFRGRRFAGPWDAGRLRDQLLKTSGVSGISDAVREFRFDTA